MPRQQVTEIIGGDTYVFGYLYTSQATEVALEVSVSLLPALGKALPKTGGLKDLMGLRMEDMDISGAFETFAKNVTPKQLLGLIKTLCSVVAVEGAGLLTEQAFEEHFKGHIGDAFKVAQKSFSVNCMDFFAAAANAAGFKKLPSTTPAQMPK